MTFLSACSVVLALSLGAGSEVCETGSEDFSVLQLASKSNTGGEPPADFHALIQNSDVDEPTSKPFEDLLAVVDEVILDTATPPLNKSLKIATDIAETLNLPTTSGLIMPRVHQPHSGIGHAINGEKFEQEKATVIELLSTINKLLAQHHADSSGDNDVASKTMELSEELSTLLQICEGDSSGESSRREWWSQRVCAARCGAATAVAGTACGVSGKCLPSLLEASKVCAACSDQFCASSWSRSVWSDKCLSTPAQAGWKPLCDFCSQSSPTLEANMLGVSVVVADEPDHIVNDFEWEAEKDVLEKIYRSTTMDPLSRSVLLEEQIVEMLTTCGTDHAGAVSLGQTDAGWWYWWKKAACFATCGGAVMASIPGCAAGIVTGGLSCAGPLVAAMGSCAGCPDILCLKPHVQLALNTGCRIGAVQGVLRPVCDFCKDFIWR